MSERTHVFPPPLERRYPVRDGRIETRSLEAHVVDHCNLTCAQCCSLSPLLPRWFATPTSLERDLALAARVLRPAVFKLVGGEPLLHPDLVALAKLARRSGIAPRISVTTNGLLLTRAPDALWKAVDAFTISLYPQPPLEAAAIAHIEGRAARFGVDLNWKRQDQFVRMNRETPADDPGEIAAIYDACWLRERCHLIRDGIFFTCTRPPHFESLSRGQQRYDSDGVRLHDGDGLRDELLAYFARARPLDACARCYGGSAVLEPHRLLSRTEIVRLRASASVR